MIKKKIKMYPWLNYLYKKIIYSKLMLCKNCNFLINFPCNLGVKYLILNLVKWILCFKKKKDICKSCINCNLIDYRNHPNFIIVKKSNLNIFFIKKIICFLNKSLYFSSFKIIYFIDFDFSNSFVFNYLLKLMEEPNYKLILFFSCFNSYNIPLTFLSRCHRYNLLAPNELYVYKWIGNYLNFSKENILTSIRLNNNSPLDTLIFLKKKWFFRIKIFNIIKNIFSINIFSMINILKNYSIEFNLYILYTFFFDIINCKYTNKIYNLDVINILKKINKYICIKSINFILKKIFFCINKVKSNLNFNKEILLYDLSYNIYNLINKKKDKGK